MAKPFIIIGIAIVVLCGCGSPTPRLPPLPTGNNVSPAPTIPPTSLQPTSTPIPAVPPSTFPLAGTWQGLAVNGSLQFEVTVTMDPVCTIGDPCGTFDIPIVPCSGTYVLAGEENGVYEFAMENKSAACGEGRDFLQLLPDGTLQFISRGDYGENTGVLTLASLDDSSATALPVIFDDDGSPDGTTALLYLLSDPAASVQAVIISHGEAHPQVYIQHMGRMLEDFGITGIPLGAGVDSALMPGEDFPEWLRQASDTFWGFPVPNPAQSFPIQDAARLMVSLLNQASEPLTVFISGPSTDLARALRLDPGIRDRIKAVYIMGGAVYVPGNLTDFSANPDNVSAEWNIYIDPLAASEVFNSGLPIFLVPLDATNQVSATMADTRQWRSGDRVADFAADMYDMLLGGSTTNQMSLWDVMTAAIMVHPELCDLVPLHLQVITDPGNTYGQTLVLTDGQPNVQVCLEPDVSGIKQTLAEEFAGSP